MPNAKSQEIALFTVSRPRISKYHAENESRKPLKHCPAVCFDYEIN
jgi:hypothetical protein